MRKKPSFPMNVIVTETIPAKDQVNCAFCTKIIHRRARACPYCSQFFQLRHEWRRPAVAIAIFSLIVAVVSGINSIYQTKVASNAEKNEKKANQAEKIANAVSEDLQVSGGLPLGPAEGLSIGQRKERELVERNFKNAPLEIAAAVKEAFILKENGHISFQWGKKTPLEGFDSSGFIAYVLYKAGVLDGVGYQLFNTTRMKQSFLHVGENDVLPGDLIIYKKGFVALYLGEDKGIGIGNAKGIQVVSLDWKKAEGAYRWTNASRK